MVRSEEPCRAEISAIFRSGLGFPPTDTHPKELCFILCLGWWDSNAVILLQSSVQ